MIQLQDMCNNTHEWIIIRKVINPLFWSFESCHDKQWKLFPQSFIRLLLSGRCCLFSARVSIFKCIWPPLPLPHTHIPLVNSLSCKIKYLRVLTFSTAHWCDNHCIVYSTRCLCLVSNLWVFFLNIYIYI